MCGIAGFIGDNDFCLNKENAVNNLVKMTNIIAHRGPDDEGCWADNNIGLGHRRLSIIDLSNAGHQPMESEDKKLVLVFNGEIYNFIELKKDLEKQGVVFKSHSDTEVILHGYRVWGKGVLQRLNGMFAFAIWDAKRNEMFLARDRVGKKPLYYSHFNNVHLFGSEIKSILSWPGFKREANLEAIHHYLTYQYVPSPLTAFDGIKKLPPAHYMVIKPGNEPLIKKYWQLNSPEKAKRKSESVLVEELDELLHNSVKARMISDVPIGAFLSGGVDSSAIVAIMAKYSEKPIKTFTIGFEEKDYDESDYARQVATLYGTEHHEFNVKPDAMALLPELVWHYNEPFADASAIPTYYISKMTSEHVKVVLNGDGGDESFIGYQRYLTCRSWLDDDLNILNRFQWKNHAKKILTKLGVRKYNIHNLTNLPQMYEGPMAFFYDSHKSLGYGNALKEYHNNFSMERLSPFFSNSVDPAASAAWADIHTYLPDDLLVKVDVATMAHSLEARSPLLDYKLMEWAASVPSDMKLKGNETKSILKTTLKPYLPDDILYRPKMGFGVPLEHWFRNELKDFTEELLFSKSFEGRQLIEPSFIRQMIKEHQEGVSLHHTRLWALIMLELWYRTWIDKSDNELITL